MSEVLCEPLAETNDIVLIIPDLVEVSSQDTHTVDGKDEIFDKACETLLRSCVVEFIVQNFPEGAAQRPPPLRAPTPPPEFIDTSHNYVEYVIEHVSPPHESNVVTPNKCTPVSVTSHQNLLTPTSGQHLTPSPCPSLEVARLTAKRRRASTLTIEIQDGNQKGSDAEDATESAVSQLTIPTSLADTRRRMSIMATDTSPPSQHLDVHPDLGGSTQSHRRMSRRGSTMAPTTMHKKRIEGYWAQTKKRKITIRMASRKQKTNPSQGRFSCQIESDTNVFGGTPQPTVNT
eukprot:PhF_6_TR33828/c0_g1_i1/m.49609